VKVAELVGYGRVVQIARQMGLPPTSATPAVALGAYELTPVEVAGAYTAFATMGTRADPFFLKSVVSAGGTAWKSTRPQISLLLDPKVAYLVDSILQDVLNKGTGAAVRARGFTLPAAGKLAHRATAGLRASPTIWSASSGSALDDNHDLGLAGGATAAPIWADFMIRATAMPAYRDVKDF